ncbi:Fic family protein [Nocardioides renjunii]|uniref:Fic family protein n=1 Tax=Nocardioides renjunii TaxID=3095075 RepID=UPI002AFF86E9|nr:Fic family protein [Nocardioides sp. S-34]
MPAFANRDDIGVLLQAALAHAQLESIHPFTDGTGHAAINRLHDSGVIRPLTTRARNQARVASAQPHCLVPEWIYKRSPTTAPIYLVERPDLPMCAFSQIQLPREPGRGPGARSKGALRASRVRPARSTTTRPPTIVASTGGKLRVARATTAQEVKRATAATAPKTFHVTRRTAVRMSPRCPMT